MTRKLVAIPSKFFSYIKKTFKLTKTVMQISLQGSGTYFVVVDPDDLKVREVFEVLHGVEVAVRQVDLDQVPCILRILNGQDRPGISNFQGLFYHLFYLF